MVGESTYLGYLDSLEKICNISSQAKISRSWTFLLLKLAVLASDRVKKILDIVAGSDVNSGSSWDCFKTFAQGI